VRAAKEPSLTKIRPDTAAPPETRLTEHNAPRNADLRESSSEERRSGRALLWKGVQMGVSKVLYLLGALILGRLLAPKEFGLVAIASVAVTTLMAATETGMTNALVRASVREQAHYDVAWTIGVLRGLLVCVVLVSAAPVIAALFGDAGAVSLVRLLAFVPLVSSMASPRQADLIRELKFGSLAGIAIAAAVADTGVAITLASTMGGVAIALGKLAGATTTMVASYVVAPHRPAFRPNYKSATQLVRFGRWMFAIAVTGVTSDVFLKLIVARRLGVAALGAFSMSDKLAETPNQLANEAIGGVAFPVYAGLRDEPARLQVVFRAHLTGLMLLLLPATAILIALALPLQERILGPQWRGSSTLIVLLTLGFLFELVFTAIYFLLQALGQGGRLFAVELAQYVVLVALVGLLAGPFGLSGIGIARIVTSIVVVAAGVMAIAPDLRRVALQLSRPGFLLALFALLAGVAAKACTLVIPDEVGVAAGAAVGAVVFFTLAWRADEPMRIGLRACLSLFFPVAVAGRQA
jgi:O-antigen/teichoic acid export membrane protein